MEHRTFIIVFGICGALSLVFQAIGLFSPAWLIFDLNIHMQDTHFTENVRLGLFTGEGCLDTGSGKQCAAFTMDKLLDTVTKSDRPDSDGDAVITLLDKLLPLQLLTIFGGITSIIAMCTVIAHNKTAHLDSSRWASGAFGICLWILSGILLIAAIGYEAHFYDTFKSGLGMLSKTPEFIDQIQISVHFPWAAVMTGTGALLCFLSGLVFSIRLCYTHNKMSTDMVGIWNKFTNQAV